MGNRKEDTRRGWKRDSGLMDTLGTLTWSKVCVPWGMCCAPGAFQTRESVSLLDDRAIIYENFSHFSRT